ncbi:MAG: ABC transporter permease [Eubacterium sp.]|nr:ABC transporter permease [Eubacterium sp.]
MFKNFDKVFKYTFKNQTNTKSYKSMLIVVSLILLILPAAIMAIANKVKKDDDNTIKPSGASAVYVVNDVTPDVDYDVLNYLGVENYDHIKYMTYDSMDEALEVANYGTDVLVLHFEKDEDEMKATIVVPEGSSISEDDADHFNDFIDQNETMVALLASGIPMANLGQMSMPVDGDIYTVSGFQNGESLMENKEAAEAVEANAVKSVFQYLVVYGTMMVLYMVILMYGNGISAHVVMEKESKLMDTMLISVHPEALVFGKMLGVLAAGFLQIFCWGISLVLGFVLGTILVESMGGSLGIISFFKSMTGMGIFTIPGIILAVVAIVFGVILYSSLSCLAGSISNNREEAATNNSIFIIVLLASFYIVLFCGLSDISNMPIWMMFVPPVAAMVLPAALLLGTIPLASGILAVVLLVAVTLALTILAGKLYKMMSLYKGNKVKLSKAIGMLFSKA